MLQVRALRTDYYQGGRPVTAIQDVHLDIEAGTALAIVGESGSGKSTMALSLMHLIRPPIGQIVSGQVVLEDSDLLALSRRAMREVLRRDIGYVPQDATTALDPVFTIERQIRESLPGLTRSERSKRILEILERLGVHNAPKRLKCYPHEFSGGMQQRVAIAVALAKRPRLLIADEPTTGLDATTQRGILDLLSGLHRDYQLTSLFITHDLEVARLMCQSVAIMYAGRIVESGPAAVVMDRPLHPYTRALLDAMPADGPARVALRTVPGRPPPIGSILVGCPFAPRCPLAIDRCNSEIPPPERHSGVLVRCWRAGES